MFGCCRRHRKRKDVADPEPVVDSLTITNQTDNLNVLRNDMRNDWPPCLQIPELITMIVSYMHVPKIPRFITFKCHMEHHEVARVVVTLTGDHLPSASITLTQPDAVKSESITVDMVTRSSFFGPKHGLLEQSVRMYMLDLGKDVKIILNAGLDVWEIVFSPSSSLSHRPFVHPQIILDSFDRIQLGLCYSQNEMIQYKAECRKENGQVVGSQREPIWYNPHSRQVITGHDNPQFFRNDENHLFMLNCHDPSAYSHNSRLDAVYITRIIESTKTGRKRIALSTTVEPQWHPYMPKWYTNLSVIWTVKTIKPAIQKCRFVVCQWHRGTIKALDIFSDMQEWELGLNSETVALQPTRSIPFRPCSFMKEWTDTLFLAATLIDNDKTQLELVYLQESETTIGRVPEWKVLCSQTLAERIERASIQKTVGAWQYVAIGNQRQIHLFTGETLWFPTVPNMFKYEHPCAIPICL